MAETCDPGLFNDVKYYIVGEIDGKIISLLNAGGAKKDTYLSDAVTHVVCDNCDNHEYGEAKDLFELPVVTSRWITLSVKCRTQLPLVGFDPESTNFFSKVVATCSGISTPDAFKLWSLINFHGGRCDAKLTPRVTHLVCTQTSGAKYEMAAKKGVAIVCPDWVEESVRRRKCIEIKAFHPKFLLTPSTATAEETEKKEKAAVPIPPSIPRKFKQSARATEELKAQQAMEEKLQTDTIQAENKSPMQSSAAESAPQPAPQSDFSANKPPTEAESLKPTPESAASASSTSARLATGFAPSSFVGSDLDLMMEGDETADASPQPHPPPQKPTGSTIVASKESSVLTHDPNDHIAAAIAAVAAGKSDLKMPSAAVEAEQVLSGQGSTFNKEKEKREKEDSSSTPPAENSATPPADPPSSITSTTASQGFGVQGVAVPMTGRGTMGFGPRSPRGRTSPRGARAKSPAGIRMPCPDQRPLGAPGLDPTKSPVSDAGPMGGLMEEGGSIGSMGMPSGGLDMGGVAVSSSSDQRSVLAQALQKELPLQGAPRPGMGPMMPRGPRPMGQGFGLMSGPMGPRSGPGMRMQMNQNNVNSSHPMVGPGMHFGPQGPDNTPPMEGGVNFGDFGAPASSSPGSLSPGGPVSPAGAMSPGAGPPTSPGGAAPTPRTKEVLARMVADRLNQQHLHMQQQQQQMMGPGSGGVSPVSSSGMGPISPQGGMMRGNPMMNQRMEFMNMQQQQQHMQGGPMMPGSPRMNHMIRGPMIRGPPPHHMGGPRMQFARGPMMTGGDGMMGGPMGQMMAMNQGPRMDMGGGGGNMMFQGGGGGMGDMGGDPSQMMHGHPMGSGGPHGRMPMAPNNPQMVGGPGPQQNFPPQGMRMMGPAPSQPHGPNNIMQGGVNMMGGQMMGGPSGMMMSGGGPPGLGPHVSAGPVGHDHHVGAFPFYGHDPSEIIPREGCLLGCTFFIADYPSIVAPRLIAAWVRVIREHGGQVLVDPVESKSQSKSAQPDPNVKVANQENESPNEKVDGTKEEDKETTEAASTENTSTSVTTTTTTTTTSSVTKDEKPSSAEEASPAVTTTPIPMPSDITVPPAPVPAPASGFEPDKVTHLLCHTQKSDIYKRAIESRKVRCVTAYWLNDVLTHKKMSQPCTAIHLPVPFLDSQKPCKNHIIAVTNFEGYDRARLKHMIQLVGAKYTGYLSRHNTVIICGKPEGPKYLKAREWRIPVVSPQWLSDILLGDYQNARNPYDPKYKQYTVETRFYLNYYNVAPLMHAWRVPIRVSKEVIVSFMQNRSQQRDTNGIEPSAAQLSEVAASNVRKALQETLDVMQPEVAKMAAEAARLRLGDLGRKKHNSDESLGNVAKKIKLAPGADDGLAGPAAPAGTESSQAAEAERDLNANREVRVMFTNLDKEYVERLKPKLVSIGIEVTNNPVLATHVVTSKLRRTLKLIAAMNVCEYVVTPEWAEACLRQSKLLPVSDEFLLRDPEGESVYCCSIQESLKRKRSKSSLFRGLTFWISQSVVPKRACVRLLIEGAGGVVDEKRPSAAKIANAAHAAIKGLAPGPSYLIITCENDLHLCRDLVAKRVPLFNVEFVLTGIMRQEVDYRAYRIDASSESDRAGLPYHKPLY